MCFVSSHAVTMPCASPVVKTIGHAFTKNIVSCPTRMEWAESLHASPAGCALPATWRAPRPLASAPQHRHDAEQGRARPSQPRRRRQATPAAPPRVRRTDTRATRPRPHTRTRPPPPPRPAHTHAGPCTTTFQFCSSFFYVSYIRLVICLLGVCFGGVCGCVLVLCVGGV